MQINSLPREPLCPLCLTEEDVLSALTSCYDPEIPVNIVDLGLIYKVNFEPVPADTPEQAKQDVVIDMTLTAQGCPEHVNISAQVKSRLEQLPGIRNAAVNVVWTPPWTPERLSPAARKQLGIE
jgi:metal-sulfur cluster biosynthetic enzyme